MSYDKHLYLLIQGISNVSLKSTGSLQISYSPLLNSLSSDTSTHTKKRVKLGNTGKIGKNNLNAEYSDRKINGIIAPFSCLSTCHPLLNKAKDILILKASPFSKEKVKIKMFCSSR